MSERMHLESNNSLWSSSWPDDDDWLNGGDEDDDRSVIEPIPVPPDIDYFDEDDFYPVEPVIMSPYEDDDDEDFDDDAEELTEAEIESIEKVCLLKNRDEVIESWRVVQPFIDKIQPSMLKKVYDGWAKRRKIYRQRIKMGDGVVRTDDEDLDVAADLFYSGTIFRDYLDWVLGLKNQERSGFQLFDSTDPEATESNSAIAWYDLSNYTVNCIGDRVETKEGFLGALAHEMWHARELRVAEEGGIDSEAGRYRDDFSKLRGQNKDEQFQNRLEQEARVFEYFFSRLLRSAMLSAPEMYDELTEPIDLSTSSSESISEVLHEVFSSDDEMLLDNSRDI